MIHLLLLLLYFTFESPWNEVNGQDWSYKNQDTWPGICVTGTSQTPIDISITETTGKILPPLHFDSNYRKKQAANIRNTGRYIQVEPENRKEKLRVSGGDLRSNYWLTQINFHWPAEHTIDNFQYPLGINFVHLEEKYSSASEAVNYQNGMAVFAVNYAISPVPNPALEPFIKSISRISKSRDIIKMHDAVSFYDLYPFDKEDFYHYHGSMIIPTCNETVSWTVFPIPSYVSLDQLNILKQIYDDNGELIERNGRNLQQRNGRHVFRRIWSFFDEYNSQ